MNEQKIWLNKPQRTAYLVRAKEEYGVWGRGTGKTEGPMALRSIHDQNIMPCGATGLVGATFMQILTRTLPPLEKAWQRYGYKPAVHYWVSQYPPKNLNIPRAIYHPRDPTYSIFWWNGHVIHFMSLDRIGLANGKTVDSIKGDEAKLLNYKRYLDDIAPTNRGNREIFGHLAEHHSITFYTDMPTDPSGKWILEKEKEVDKKQIGNIINLQLEFNKIELEANHPKTTKARKIYLLRKLRNYASALNELRKGSIFYSEASSLDNIEVLGEEQFRQWERELIPHIYKSSVLNKRVVQVENGFYGLLDLDKHTYDAYDYSHIDNLYLSKSVIIDSRSDADVNRRKPLDISLDYGAKINCMTVGQHHENEYRVLNALHVKDNDRLKELITKFMEYYRHHPTKEVNYIYDHTAVGTDATRTFSYADEVSRLLYAGGWAVNKVNIGQQPFQDTRYRMWQMVFKEDDPRFVPVRINKSNCAQLLVALQRARVRQTGKLYEKDKRDERNSLIAQEETTHFTDAFDSLYIGKFRHKIGYAVPSTSLVFTNSRG